MNYMHIIVYMCTLWEIVYNLFSIQIKDISSDMLVIEEDVHQNDYRLNTATPLRTFSIKHNNNKVKKRVALLHVGLRLSITKFNLAAILIICWVNLLKITKFNCKKLKKKRIIKSF